MLSPSAARFSAWSVSLFSTDTDTGLFLPLSYSSFLQANGDSAY